ncbi:hypothetical protein Prudu_009485, partial [Prunus dulcis]
WAPSPSPGLLPKYQHRGSRTLRPPPQERREAAGDGGLGSPASFQAEPSVGGFEGRLRGGGRGQTYRGRHHRLPLKTVQFVNHMILGSQMELPEVDELPKKLLREQAGRAFRLQASASMEMWLCVKRAISAAERVKKAYDDGRAKVAEAGKALQDHAQLLKEKEAAERPALSSETKAEETRVALEAAQAAARDAEAASEAVQDALEESEWTKAAEIEAAVRSAVQGYRSSEEFTTLLDGEVDLRWPI